MTKNSSYNLIADNDVIPWLDDNETKYKWNGALTNLSDMDPKDYATTTFNVNIISGITGTTREENPVAIELVEGTDIYTIKVSSSKPVASELTIAVVLSGDTYSLKLPVLETSVTQTTTIPVSQMVEIESATIVPSKDDTYQYNVVLPESDVKFTAYYGPYAEYKKGTISTEDIVALPAITVTTTEQEISFVLKQRKSSEITEDDKYCLLLAVPYNVYEKHSFVIKDKVFGNDLMLSLQGNFMLNNKKYALLASIAEGNEYTAKGNRDVTLLYGIKSEKK